MSLVALALVNNSFVTQCWFWSLFERWDGFEGLVPRTAFGGFGMSFLWICLVTFVTVPQLAEAVFSYDTVGRNRAELEIGIYEFEILY